MIRRGEPWGSATTMPGVVVIAKSDRAIATTDRSQPLFPESGDIARSLGNPAIPAIGRDCMEVSIDAMLCIIALRDEAEKSFVAASSLVVGSPWRGRQVIISNAGWVNGLNVAPRAHPNDGFVEMMTISSGMNRRQRVLARRRMRTGTHLPHPDISMNRINSAVINRNPRERLLIDGQEIPEWTSFSMQVHPDYWRVLV